MHNLNILVVDDEAAIRELCKEKLSLKGCAAKTASSGQEALDLIAQEFFDIVITDLNMPGDVQGLRVLEAAKRENEETAVIIITGYASIDSAIEAMRKGAVDYLCKPLKFDELFIRLERIARDKELIKPWMQ